jgi:hypothetical protein
MCILENFKKYFMKTWTPIKDKNYRKSSKDLYVTITKKSKTINLSQTLVDFLDLKHRLSHMVFVEDDHGNWFLGLSPNGYPVSIKGAIGVVYAWTLILELSAKLKIEADRERFKVEKEPFIHEGMTLYKIIPNEFELRP